VALAVEQAHEVTVFNRGRRPSSLDRRVTTIRGDRDDRVRLEQTAKDTRYDVVVDFLGFAPEQVDLALGAFADRVGQYVFISSASVYEKPPRHFVISEATPLANPFWEYARKKIACEDRVWRARQDHGFPVTIVRPSYTYGPSWVPSGFGGQDYTVVNRIRHGNPIVCHGDGTSLFVMTASSDFAVGLLGLLGNSRALGEAVHITSDEVLTWNEIYETIGRAAGREPRIVHAPSDLIAALYPERGGSLLGDKAQSTVFDNTKIKKLVPAYRAHVAFAEGMARSLAWYDADPARRLVNKDMNHMIERVLAAQQRAFGG
jgi:nucleoside-diphosphate-sugar epimerase